MRTNSQVDDNNAAYELYNGAAEELKTMGGTTSTRHRNKNSKTDQTQSENHGGTFDHQNNLKL